MCRWHTCKLNCQRTLFWVFSSHFIFVLHSLPPCISKIEHSVKKTTFDLMFLMSMLNRQKNRPRIYKRRIILLISYELKFKKHFIFISSLAFNFNIAFYYSGVVKISKFYMTLCIYMLYVSFVSVSLKTTHLS